jgi:archaemetzincin
MKMISLMPVGRVDRTLLEPLAEGLTRRLRVACSIQPGALEPEFAFNALRRQYHSTEILKKILQRPAGADTKTLGVTDIDLYIPVLTFVFGEAQLADGGAVVSAHRLHQEFYGLPMDRPLLEERLLKEALHELGHTYGLRHCSDYACVMSPSNSVERIDLKGADFCSLCAQAIPFPDR